MVIKQKTHAILPEFLIPASKYNDYLQHSTVIYVQTDNLPAGYYKIINFGKFDINIATQFGLCTVNVSDCYFTQELIAAIKRSEQIIFTDKTAHSGLDKEWLDEVQEAERRSNPINQIEL